MTLPWRHFIVRYTIVALAGSCVVHLGSGFLQLPPRQRAPISRPSSPSPAVRPGVNHTRPSADCDTTPAARIDGTRTNRTATDIDERMAAAKQSHDTPVMPDPIAGQWGVVSRDQARCYAPSGQFLQRLDAGTLVDITNTRASTEVGALAVCNIHTGRVIQKNILIAFDDIDVQPGPLDSADPDEVALRTHQAATLAAMTTRVKSLRSSVNKNNPHAAEYTEVQQRHAAFWKRVKELQKQRDEAVGGNHMSIIDELRRMKGEDIRLAHALETTRQKYQAWQDQHPVDIPTDDTELAQLKARLQDIQQRLNVYDRSP